MGAPSTGAAAAAPTVTDVDTTCGAVGGVASPLIRYTVEQQFRGIYEQHYREAKMVDEATLGLIRHFCRALAHEITADVTSGYMLKSTVTTKEKLAAACKIKVGDEKVGKPGDVEEAIKWFKVCAMEGNAEAALELAVIYYCGEHDSVNTPPRSNLVLALIWYLVAATLGGRIVAAPAAFSIAHIMYNGIMADGSNGLPVPMVGHRRASYSWFHDAAQRGDADAAIAYSYCLRDGSSGVPDMVHAARWMLIAAAQHNNTKAQYGYGRMLMHDPTLHAQVFQRFPGCVDAKKYNVPKRSTVEYWLQKAADAGSYYAAYVLGWLYSKGFPRGKAKSMSTPVAIAAAATPTAYPTTAVSSPSLSSSITTPLVIVPKSLKLAIRSYEQCLSISGITTAYRIKTHCELAILCDRVQQPLQTPDAKVAASSSSSDSSSSKRTKKPQSQRGYKKEAKQHLDKAVELSGRTGVPLLHLRAWEQKYNSDGTRRSTPGAYTGGTITTRGVVIDGNPIIRVMTASTTGTSSTSPAPLASVQSALVPAVPVPSGPTTSLMLGSTDEEEKTFLPITNNGAEADDMSSADQEPSTALPPACEWSDMNPPRSRAHEIISHATTADNTANITSSSGSSSTNNSSNSGGIYHSSSFGATTVAVVPLTSVSDHKQATASDVTTTDNNERPVMMTSPYEVLLPTITIPTRSELVTILRPVVDPGAAVIAVNALESTSIKCTDTDSCSCALWLRLKDRQAIGNAMHQSRMASDLKALEMAFPSSTPSMNVDTSSWEIIEIAHTAVWIARLASPDIVGTCPWVALRSIASGALKQIQVPSHPNIAEVHRTYIRPGGFAVVVLKPYTFTLQDLLHNRCEHRRTVARAHEQHDHDHDTSVLTGVEILHILAQVVTALVHLQRHNQSHRNLIASNILFDTPQTPIHPSEFTCATITESRVRVHHYGMCDTVVTAAAMGNSSNCTRSNHPFTAPLVPVPVPVVPSAAITATIVPIVTAVPVVNINLIMQQLYLLMYHMIIPIEKEKETQNENDSMSQPGAAPFTVPSSMQHIQVHADCPSNLRALFAHLYRYAQATPTSAGVSDNVQQLALLSEVQVMIDELIVRSVHCALCGHLH